MIILSDGPTFSLRNRGRRISAKRRRLIAKLCSRIVMKIGARVTPVIVGIAYSIQCLGFDISIRSSLHSPVSDRYFRLDQCLADGDVSLRIDRRVDNAHLPFTLIFYRIVLYRRCIYRLLFVVTHNMHLNVMFLIFI